MRAIDKDYHLPVVLGLFAAFFTYMVVRDLQTGEIWRGGPEPTITLSRDATQFYVMIVFLSGMALTFWGGTIALLYTLFSRHTKR